MSATKNPNFPWHQKPALCTKCGSIFLTKDGLDEHNEMEHGNLNEDKIKFEVEYDENILLKSQIEVEDVDPNIHEGFSSDNKDILFSTIEFNDETKDFQEEFDMLGNEIEKQIHNPNESEIKTENSSNFDLTNVNGNRDKLWDTFIANLSEFMIKQSNLPKKPKEKKRPRVKRQI